VINQADLTAKLDAFFDVRAYDERVWRESFPAGYESVFQRYAAPGFWDGSWNGLMLSNAGSIARFYPIVFPTQNVLDTIIAREVERGAPGAIIFCHHMADYHENGGAFVPITEAQLEELKEHHISYYVCHAPLDCHPQISTSTALANALKLKDQARFGAYRGGQSGVYGKVGGNTPGFHDFGKRVAEACGLPGLRYYAVRHNGRPVLQVGIVTGLGGRPEHIREALDLGCDTFVTGEWWLYGPGEWRARSREKMHEFLQNADVNLIGTSHYASEAVVMREQMPAWVRENAPSVEPMFIAQDDPWR
jgi:putative NIF3 family GTP cyclohydrolase 1 type 2